jgi:two-component system alkaline phosphatase synthesis response regulator PhoP
MNNQSILIVEDEINLGETLSDYLNDKGFECSYAKNVSEARGLFDNNTFSVILMDITLPDGNGIELAKEFKKKRSNFVLIYLSALNDPETKYHGLEMGAEDYITKPFDLRELTLRLNKALVTHNHLAASPDTITLGKLEIHFKEYYLLDANKNRISLGQKECAILELLYSKINQVIARDEIIEKIWEENAFPTNRTVDNYIVKLRKWIETDSTKAFSINSVRGVGYKLEKNN